MSLEVSRRQVLTGMTVAAGSLLTGGVSATAASGRQDRWAAVRAAYAPSKPMMNLNNAGVSPQPLLVQNAFIEAYRFANGEPDVNMWETLDGTRERTKAKLARLVECDIEELALNRNSTEGLCTAIHGIDLSAGEEVLLSPWDYDSMRQAWLQRGRRHGVVAREVNFDALASDDDIVDSYRRAINKRTRVMHLTHMLHSTGRVLPVARLCELARKHNLQTIVDAAQSFAHIPLSFRQIGCDYLAASLHKWLCAPFGTGMLVVRKERIEALWPLVAPLTGDAKGIAKIDGWNLGTYSSPAEHTIEPAIDFHNALGTATIHARLRELSRYWIDKARALPGFTLHTPLDEVTLGAVTLFSMAGRSSEALEAALRERHFIRVRFRRINGLTGLRVSPHIYTSTDDLDNFVSALAAEAGRG
jgi:selenocysteine lyase/cysteine desulfurase